MRGTLLTSIVAIGLALAGPFAPASGGGWSVATLDDWPTQVVANQPFTISFGLRLHGQSLMRGRTGRVEFEDLGKPGQAPLRFDVRPALAEGHYSATITLPSAGTWRWRIEAFGSHTMRPLVVYATAASAARPTDAPQQPAIGRLLFVAKGCSTCHLHPEVPEARSSFGPPLPMSFLTAEYLQQWLSDPKAVKPATLMPNLGLKPSEVEALTAFLAAEPS